MRSSHRGHRPRSELERSTLERSTLEPDVVSTNLPIDAHLDEVARLLHEPGAVLIVEAPPGAGKTTRLPARLLSAPWCTERVLVTEPRRIAARLAAHRVAAERACQVGEEVGYQVRFEDKTGPLTRLVYATEGLVLRQLLEEGQLLRTSVLVLDEVHERSADLDVLVALLKKARTSGSPLRLALMSATLDAQYFKDAFPGASLFTSPGRSFDVAIEHAPKDDDRPLPVQVRSAVKAALPNEGDVLVFLPGGAEIRACEEALTALGDVEIVPLHGDLPLEAQARAMKPGSKKRVILSTNVAESSVTIPAVTTVVDSGLARLAIFDHWSGVKRLETVEISQARCAQRAGRAGRVAPGRAFRLFTKGSLQRRPEQDPPALLREDLSGIMLNLLASGHDPRELPWLSAPSDSAWDQAQELLEALGAVAARQTTPLGKEMARLPLPPRLSRVVMEGAKLGVKRAACRAAALLSERDILLGARRYRSGPQDITASDSDIEDRLELLAQLEDGRFDRLLARDLNLDVQGSRQVVKTASSLERAVRTPAECGEKTQADVALKRALFSGFPDRVSERRGGGRQLVFCTGAQASLHESSSVVHANLLLALSTDAPGGKRRQAQVRLACRLEPDLLMEVAGEKIGVEEQILWNTSREKLEQVSRLSYGKVTLDESRSSAGPSKQGAALLMKAALTKGAAVYDSEGHLESLCVRLTLLVKHLPELIPTSSGAPPEGVAAIFEGGPPSLSRLTEQALLAACETRSSLQELAEARLDQELLGSFPADLTRALERELPRMVRLRGGSELEVHYEQGRDPWVESRLQNFFSMNETPLLCRGKLPLQLHLLAPNRRAVQVTTDLAGFWDRHYPELRKQLMRRYPKHLWPEDGRTARPPEPGRIR